MMFNNIPRLNHSGYLILEELADTAPYLFVEGDSTQLKKSIRYLAGQKGVRPYDPRDIKLKVPLDTLNQLKEKGPGTDAGYAPLVRQAVAGLSPDQASDSCFWASINCVLSPYITVRWSTSKLKKQKPDKFVRKRWLWEGGKSRVWNAGARLWWLAETAYRAAEFSERSHSPATFLGAMANNVGLYHQLMSRGYAVRDPVLVAAIYDVALDGNHFLFKAEHANELFKAMNIKSDSFGILDYEELHQIVLNSLPFATGETGTTGLLQ